MSEPLQKLREALGLLHEHLEESDSLDASSRAELREAAQDIRSAIEELEPEGDGAELEGSLVERLRDALRRFEGAHPKLTAITGRVIDQLAELGI